MTGACVYAGNNSRLKAIALRQNGALVGYEEKRSKVRGLSGKLLFTIKPLGGGSAVEVLGVPKPGKTATSTWDPKDPVKLLPSTLKKELVVTAEGKLKMRADSSAVFRIAAQGLKEKYPATAIEPFANVHDDELDGGTEADSLDHFMDAMEDLSDTQANLDFFAYSGHGGGRSLPSAGLKMKTKMHDEFVGHLKKMLRPNATIIMYACCTGVPGGLSQQLSSDLPGVTVFGHECAGHGMTNPEKARCFNGQHVSYKALLGPDYERWIRLIKDPASDVWRRFPWMTLDQIRAELK